MLIKSRHVLKKKLYSKKQWRRLYYPCPPERWWRKSCFVYASQCSGNALNFLLLFYIWINQQQSHVWETNGKCWMASQVALTVNDETVGINRGFAQNQTSNFAPTAVPDIVREGFIIRRATASLECGIHVYYKLLAVAFYAGARAHELGKSGDLNIAPRRPSSVQTSEKITQATSRSRLNCGWQPQRQYRRNKSGKSPP